MGIFLNDHGLELEVLKHGSHNQASHGGKGGGRKGGSGGGGGVDDRNSGSTTPMSQREQGGSSRADQNNEFADKAVTEIDGLDAASFGDDGKVVTEVQSALGANRDGDPENPTIRETIMEDGYTDSGAQISRELILDDKKMFISSGKKLIATKNPTLVAAGEKIVAEGDKMYDVFEND